jgi:hypothetical protein
MLSSLALFAYVSNPAISLSPWLCGEIPGHLFILDAATGCLEEHRRAPTARGYARPTPE